MERVAKCEKLVNLEVGFWVVTVLFFQLHCEFENFQSCSITEEKIFINN